LELWMLIRETRSVVISYISLDRTSWETQKAGIPDVSNFLRIRMGSARLS
jgi:hypothetical protein